jgi:hypothetical protein
MDRDMVLLTALKGMLLRPASGFEQVLAALGLFLMTGGLGAKYCLLEPEERKQEERTVHSVGEYVLFWSGLVSSLLFKIVLFAGFYVIFLVSVSVAITGAIFATVAIYLSKGIPLPGKDDPLEGEMACAFGIMVGLLVDCLILATRLLSWW